MEVGEGWKGRGEACKAVGEVGEGGKGRGGGEACKAAGEVGEEVVWVGRSGEVCKGKAGGR